MSTETVVCFLSVVPAVRVEIQIIIPPFSCEYLFRLMRGPHRHKLVHLTVFDDIKPFAGAALSFADKHLSQPAHIARGFHLPSEWDYPCFALGITSSGLAANPKSASGPISGKAFAAAFTQIL